MHDIQTKLSEPDESLNILIDVLVSKLICQCNTTYNENADILVKGTNFPIILNSSNEHLI